MSRREFGVPARYGRGGAGNIDTVSQENARVAADLEANQSTTDSFAQTSSPINVVQPSYVGRGGAGNYGSSEDPSNWDSLESTASAPSSRTCGENQAQSPTYGRGGAGNYAAGNPAYQRYLSRRTTEEQQKREKLQADIEQGVNEQLSMPRKAKLPSGNS